MSRDQKQTCMFCKWWSFTQRYGIANEKFRGECRVNGPERGSLNYGVFPVMDGEQWCGRYADRPDDHVTELPSTWEHISEPVGRVIENSANAYLNGSEDVA